MNTKTRAGFALLLAASVSACASSSNQNGQTDSLQVEESFIVKVRGDPTVHEYELQNSAEQVWAVVPAAFKELGYPGAPSAKHDYVYLTPYLNIRGKLYPGEFNSKYLNCGQAASYTPAADSYDVTFVIIAFVDKRPGGGSRVRVLVDGRARDRGQSSHAVPCSGTGVLEKAIGELIALRANS